MRQILCALFALSALNFLPHGVYPNGMGGRFVSLAGESGGGGVKAAFHVLALTVPRIF